MRIFRTKLHRCPRTLPRSRVNQPHRLQRAKTRCISSRSRDFLDRLTCLEKIFRLEIFLDNAFCRQKLVNEPLVFLFVERSIQIIPQPLFVAALPEKDIHVQRIGHNDRGGRIEKCKMFKTSYLTKRFGQRIAGQWPCCNNKSIEALGFGTQVACFPALKRNQGMRANKLSNPLRKKLPIYRKGTARCNLRFKRHSIKNRSQLIKFPFQHACCGIGVLTL